MVTHKEAYEAKNKHHCEVVVLQDIAEHLCFIHDCLLKDKSESAATAVCLLKIANMAINLALAEIVKSEEK